MDGITLGQIIEIGAWILGAGATIGGLCKMFNAGLKVALKPLNDKMDAMAENNKRVELESHKNFLVRFLADIEQGQPIDEIELERFHEVYSRYTSPELGGNSYIHDKVEKLKKLGKI